MKRLTMLVSSIVFSMFFSAITILAADNFTMPFVKYGSQQSSHIKNQCLLFAKNCVTESSSVQQRVIDLRMEIAKGLAAYTPNELKTLKEQLKWIESDSSNEII